MQYVVCPLSINGLGIECNVDVGHYMDVCYSGSKGLALRNRQFISFGINSHLLHPFQKPRVLLYPKSPHLDRGSS